MKPFKIALIASLAGLGLPQFAAAHPGSYSGHDDVCTPGTDEGEKCWIAVDDLKPTQLTFGAIEVARRSADYAKLSDKKREDYLKKNRVPLVVGPNGEFYVTDHHHMALAVAAVEGKKFEVAAVIQKNWRHLDAATFWADMASAQYTYLFDADGSGPLATSALGEDLFSLENDPYRSLAWGVRKAGAYEDTAVPHADFLWAEYFRTRIARDDISEDFDQAVVQAAPLAHADAARHLPGYQP